jgi:hypothetical protein
MMQVKSAVQFQPRADKDAYRSLGIIWMPAQRVTDAARAIAYDRPGGWFAQTWLGNIQMAPGDWLVTCGSGNKYVVKQADYFPDFGASAWRSFWRRFFR